MFPLVDNLARFHKSMTRPVAPRDNSIARFEIKYLVDYRLLKPLRDFLHLFCVSDPYCIGDPPCYQVTSLYFDSAFGDLYMAKEHKTADRFKLRARAYGPSETSPMFLEIKRRHLDIIVKSRAAFKPGWGDLKEIILGDKYDPMMKESHKDDYLEFVRTLKAIDAKPTMRISYQRESFIGENDDYARATFDTNLKYMPTHDWEIVPATGKWQHLDSSTSTNHPCPAFVFELKCTEFMPTWMLEVIDRFSLNRCDFCKYANGMRLDSLYRGFSYSDASDNTTY